jgi:prepilin-type N-terminal cleavage/methylation domain-containing protein
MLIPEKHSQSGFTIIELLVAMTLAVLIGITFFTFFKTSMVQYLNLQQDGSTATTLAAQEARLTTVLRSVTGILSASNNDLVVYAYFYPSDTYVSQLHYYISNGQLLVDLSRMTSNPPIGTVIAGSSKTYTIIPNLYQGGSAPLFVYIDSSNTNLSSPVTDLNAIKQIQVNLAGTLAAGGNQAMSVQVDLRNRKTNL